MANTLTNLIPTLYTAADRVSRELTGFIPAVDHDGSLERAAKDQSIRVPITTQPTAADITPAVSAPDNGDETVGNVEITISKVRGVGVRWAGEETQGLRTAGTYESVAADRFAQAMRTLVNEVETDLAALYVSSSRAFGTAATTPFGTANEFDDAAEVVRILDENGAPAEDRQLVLDSAAIAKLRGYQPLLLRQNESGSSLGLTEGMLPNIHGLTIRNSAQVKSHTKGTATGFDANGGEPVGETDLVMDGSSAGTILAGDVVTFAGDANKYIVSSGSTLTGNATGTMIIAEPGLKIALADTVEGTIGATYRANMAFNRSAIKLVTRAPMLPDGGDEAVDRTTVTDPNSGLSFEVSAYRQYRQVRYEVALAWGVKAIKPEHMAILLG